MSLKLQAPLEVGVNVHDLKKMRAFYEGVLGLTVVHEVHVPAPKAQAAALSQSGYTVIRLQTSNGERIKLLAADAPVAPGATGAAFILDQPNSLYLTFIIDDIRAVCKQLNGHGITFMTGQDPIEVRPGTWLAFFRDPEGNIIELVQYDDVAAYRPDLKH